MSEESMGANEITDGHMVILDFSKLKSHGAIVVRLPEKLDLSTELDRISILWLKDAGGVKKVKYRDGGTKLTLTLTRKGRKRPPMFPILYSVRHLMPYEFVTEMAVQFDRKHTNQPLLEEMSNCLIALTGIEWMGLKKDCPVYVIATKILGESTQRIWVIPAATEPITS